MPFEIKKPFVPKKTFIINRNLHLDAKDKVVEEGDAAGKKVLGGKGKAFYEAEAKHYGLDESHRLVEEEPLDPKDFGAVSDSSAEPVSDVGEEPEKPVDAPEELKGKLPTDFPAHYALTEAGINTYGQLRKAVAKGTPENPWYAEISGIADKTAEKIAEALATAPEE